MGVSKHPAVSKAFVETLLASRHATKDRQVLNKLNEKLKEKEDVITELKKRLFFFQSSDLEEAKEEKTETRGKTSPKPTVKRTNKQCCVQKQNLR